MKKYEDLNSLELDALKEIGNIGAGNAATALSQSIDKKIRMTLPIIKILDYNAAVEFIGKPELIVAGELVALDGEIKGVMMHIQKLDFVNLVLEKLMNKRVSDFSQLNDLDLSAISEIGNILISSYVSAISSFTGFRIEQSVPQMSINMLGGIVSTPMIMFGYESNKIMIVDANFINDDGATTSSNLLFMPDVKSLNMFLERLGVTCG